MIKEFKFNDMSYSADETGKVFGRDGEIKQRLDSCGYPCVTIGSKHVKRNCIRVHRIIAKLFVENFINKPEVNHIDGIKTNNNYENLEWVTRKEQMIHASKMGLLNDHRGEKNPRSLLKQTDVLEIRKLYNSKIKNVAQLARMYGRGWQTINHIIKRTTWTHI